MLHSLAQRERLIGVAYVAGWMALLSAIAVAIWFAARIAWHLVAATPPATELAVAVDDPDGPSNAGGARIDLAALHLFGQSVIGAPLTVTANAPDTSLDLRLLGTLVEDSGGTGMAIIADGDDESLYAVGDPVTGDAKLHEVHADRVILIHLGRYETLRLREEDPAAPGRRRGTNPGRTATATATPNLQRLDWQAAQRDARLDPARLAQQIRALPIIENGQPIGFRLQAGRDAALIGKLGLRPTDVITAVNGIPLNDPARAFELINQLNSETRFNVELRRDGREMTLAIDAGQLRE